MSCVHLHLGQAGIQLGESFWELAEEEFFADSSSVNGGERGGRRRDGCAQASRKVSSSVRMHPGGAAMFHEDSGWARCLAVDSEPKVVQRFRDRVGSLRPENAIFSQSGLANNWAMGFASCRSSGGDEVNGGGGGPFSLCMESMRKEAERSSWFNSVVMTHSLAGGTGSGLGSGLLQALRDEYPSIYLISACVGPFGVGDTPLQHYNSVLALQHLQAYADCVIYRDNDDLLRGVVDASARKDAAASSDTARMVSRGSGGGGGGGGGGWQPFGLSTRRGGGGGGGGGSGGGGNRRRTGIVVSTTDMNASLALDMASYFFPTSRPFDHVELTAVAAARGPRSHGRGHVHSHSHSHSHRQRRQNHQQETAPRPFDGGSLMAAACPLPGAKFVDLRSSLSIEPAASAAAAAALSCSSAVAGSPVGESTWRALAALAHDLGRKSPLCPSKGGGVEDDACVAAHHVVRGITSDARAAAAGPGVGGREACSVAEGEAQEGDGTSFNGRRRRHTSSAGKCVGVSPSVAAAAAAAVPKATTGPRGEEYARISEALRRHHECPEWRTATDFSAAPALRSRGGIQRSVTTVCNQTRIRWVLGDMVARAEEKFKARAYLHWYHHHGLEDEDFLAAFEGVRSVERGYDGLARAFGGGGGGGGGGPGSVGRRRR